MKTLSRRSLSRKLIWCRRKFETFFTRKQYKSEQEGNESRCFMEELPDEVMQEILQRMPLSDYLNCRKVSRRWRTAIDSKRWLPAAHHQLPWLVTGSSLETSDMLASYIKTDDDNYLRMVSHPNIGKLITKRFYHSYGYCAGSIEGWLIITRNRTTFVNSYKCFFFWNPVSGARVKLPSHIRGDAVEYMPAVVKVAASSVPTSTMCYVSCLHYNYTGNLAFCTPTYKSWTVIEKALIFLDIEIFDGKLYAIVREASEFVMVFDIHLDTHAYTFQRSVTLHPNIRSINLENNYDVRRCYMATCSESKDLFMILYHFWLGRSPEKHRSFQVLKLENNGKWVEIDDLGDRALFVATLNNKFITCHDKTVERNSIYFNILYGQYYKRYDSGVFSLTDRSFKPMIFSQKYHRDCPRLHRSAWFTPNPC